MVTVRKSSDIPANRRLSILSIGDSRTGKTHFSGTMCDHEKVLFINAEKGLETVRGKSFDEVVVNDYKQFKEVFNWYLSGGHKDYTMLVIDSINRVQTYLQYELNDEGKLTQNQWGEVLATLRKMIDTLDKHCPTSFHVTTMASESKDELTGQIKIYPNLQGAFRYELTGYFDTVLYHKCAIDNSSNLKYWCQLHSDNRITAGTRVRELSGDKNIPNDYSYIKTKINGSKV